jgi:hypothetical protein
VTVWETDSPGPDPGERSRFAGRSLPAFGGERTVAWYHDADRTTTAFVRPSTERLALDGLVEFEMVNNGRDGLRCGHWNPHELVDGGWFHVAPLVHTADCRVLHRGVACGGRSGRSPARRSASAVAVATGSRPGTSAAASTASSRATGPRPTPAARWSSWPASR